MLLGLSAPAIATASMTVSVPIRVDVDIVEDLLLETRFSEPGQTARVWDDGSRCNYLLMSDPVVAMVDEGLRILSRGEAQVGHPYGDACLFGFEWSGFVEVIQQPVLGAGARRIGFRVVDSHLYDPDMKERLLTGIIWNWSKQYAHPHLESLEIDFENSLVRIGAAIASFMTNVPEDERRRVADSLAFSTVGHDKSGIVAEIRLAVPESALIPDPPPEPRLSDAELAAFERAWQEWDAFITYIVKHSALLTTEPVVRDVLLEVLLESRHDLIDVLTQPVDRQQDPVRALFIRTWERLAPVLRRMQSDPAGGAQFHLAGFIAAADALQAIDALSPGAGWDVSADGLRRLARFLTPDAADDPLRYDESVDPQLRELFDFGPPLTPPETSPPPARRGQWIAPAFAAVTLTRRALDRLNAGWIPRPDDLTQYLGAVHALLGLTINRLLDDKPVDKPFDELVRPLVLATAWQESCWRQFVERRGEVVPLRSSAGAVGMMQVVPAVWRGFYESKSLSADIAYNSAAGSEILRHYLLKYAVPRGEHHYGGADSLARATYAAYNGGPGQLDRYRRADTKPAFRRIDDAFWEKYRRTADGDELAVMTCYGP